VAEGAALEMPCTGNRTVGSNPTPSAKFVTLDRSQTLPRGEKDRDARRRRMAARDAYSLYVERAANGANEADGALSARGAGGPC
jgi:hypothetical protein